MNGWDAITPASGLIDAVQLIASKEPGRALQLTRLDVTVKRLRRRTRGVILGRIVAPDRPCRGELHEDARRCDGGLRAGVLSPVLVV